MLPILEVVLAAPVDTIEEDIDRLGRRQNEPIQLLAELRILSNLT